MAVQEVAANGLVHGRPPVHISLWTDVDTLTCLSRTPGRGTSTRWPVSAFPTTGPHGVVGGTATVDDLFIGTSPSAGCSVLLTAT